MQSEDPRVNELFAGKYIVRSLIGKGAVSVVYKVDHAILRKPLALKVLRVDGAIDETAAARFAEDAKAAGTLNHSNLVQVNDQGITKSGAPYLVMDYCQGESIALLIKKHNAFSMDQAIPVFIQICSGLSYMHARGIVHKDIKPSNIVVTKDERGLPVAKLLDFGLAEFLPTVNSSVKTVTEAGEVFGNPLYISPEQARGESVDTRSDVYSLACVMYEMLTGTPPLVGENAAQTINMQIYEQPQPVSSLNAMVPEAINSIIMRALSKDLQIRYQSVDELKQDLTRVAAGGQPEALPPTETEVEEANKREVFNRVAIGATALLFVLAVAFIFTHKTVSPWQASLAQAKEQIQKGDFAMAEMSYKEASTQAKDANPGEKAEIDIAWGDLRKRMGDKNKKDLEDALAHYNSALPLIESSNYDAIAHTNEGLGDCLHALKQYDNAEIYFSNAVEIRHEREAKDPYALAAVLIKQGRNFKDNAKYEKAELALREAIAVQQKLGFVQQAYVPQCLNGLAQIAAHYKENRRAALLKEAADLQKGIGGPDDPQLATLLDKRNKLIEQAFANNR